MSQSSPGFNYIERHVAKILEGFPGLRSNISSIYKRVNYLLRQEKGFIQWVHPDATLVTPHQWAGLEECVGYLFFGYYDKSPWSSGMTKALFHYHDGKRLSVIMIDRDANTAKNLGITPSWNWQQGAMAQWVGQGEGQKAIFNTVQDSTLGCLLIDLENGQNRFIPWPVQAVHPGGKKALSLNYLKLMQLRPDYGYDVEATNFRHDQDLAEDGVFGFDLESGNGSLIYSLKHLSMLVPENLKLPQARHKVNHCIYSPSGRHFAFLHRVLSPNKGKHSLLYVGTDDGERPRFLMGSRVVSHYHWKDDLHLLAYARADQGDRYYLINIETAKAQCVGMGVLDAFGDGHCTFSQDGNWILTDTYPDKARQQRLFLFDYNATKLTEVGRFFSPWTFMGPGRCDLHPRLSPDNQWISFDSGHTGLRKSYFVNISKILER